MDVLSGHKFIYTDPILPEINTDIIKKYVSDYISSSKCTDSEKERNTIN